VPGAEAADEVDAVVVAAVVAGEPAVVVLFELPHAATPDAASASASTIP
jgi:hypothetical protein